MEQVIRIKMLDKDIEVELSENMITQSTIKAAFLLPFDAVIALCYEVNGRTKWCKMNEAGTCFLLPDGWLTMQFFAESDKVSSRPATPMDQSQNIAPVEISTDLSEKQKEYIERLKKLMFYSILTRTEAGTFENVSTIRNCVTVAEKETALMAAHCLPIGVAEGFEFEIYSQEDQPRLVQVKYINRNFDFVVLKTVGKGFDAHPIGLAYPEVGTEYAVLGYHGYNYQVSHCLSGFFGRVRNNEHSPHLSFVLGSPGTTRGCSGSGAFTYSRLLGIVVSGCVSPQNVYSNTGSLADHIAEAYTELAEPSYSHIVPSATIFALFDEYSKLLS